VGLGEGSVVEGSMDGDRLGIEETGLALGVVLGVLEGELVGVFVGFCVVGRSLGSWLG